MPKLQVLKTLSEKIAKISEMSHTDASEGNFFFFSSFSLSFDHMPLTMTEIRFIMMINSKKATTNVSVLHL